MCSILYVNVTCHLFLQISKMSKPKDIIDQEPDIPFYDVHEVIVPHLGHIPIAKGDFHRLPKKAQKFIAFYVSSDWNVLLLLTWWLLGKNTLLFQHSHYVA